MNLNNVFYVLLIQSLKKKIVDLNKSLVLDGSARVCATCTLLSNPIGLLTHAIPSFLFHVVQLDHVFFLNFIWVH